MNDFGDASPTPQTTDPVLRPDLEGQGCGAWLDLVAGCAFVVVGVLLLVVAMTAIVLSLRHAF